MRAEFLFRSRDLATWEYLHPFVEGDIFGLAGDDGGCPYFWPIGDRHILLHFSHMSGAHYLLGDYDTARDKFVVDRRADDFTFGALCPGGVHAPSATPDGKGGVIAIFNINAAKPTPGWDQIMSLPRRLTLAGRDELAIEPAGDVESLRDEPSACGAAWRCRPTARSCSTACRATRWRSSPRSTRGSRQMVELNVLRSPGREEFTRIAFFRGRGYVDWDRSDGWTRYGSRATAWSRSTPSYSSKLPDVTSRAPGDRAGVPDAGGDR